MKYFWNINNKNYYSDSHYDPRLDTFVLDPWIKCSFFYSEQNSFFNLIHNSFIFMKCFGEGTIVYYITSNNYLSQPIQSITNSWHFFLSAIIIEYVCFYFHCHYHSEATVIPYLDWFHSFLTAVSTFTLWSSCFNLSLHGIQS